MVHSRQWQGSAHQHLVLIALSGSPVVRTEPATLSQLSTRRRRRSGSVTFLDSNGAMANSSSEFKRRQSGYFIDCLWGTCNHRDLPRRLPHTSAQSTVFGLTVSPLPLTSGHHFLDPSTYGEPVPPLTGTLNGLLPRDQSTVSATFVIPPPLCRRPVPMQLRSLSQEPAQGITAVAAAPTFTITPCCNHDDTHCEQCDADSRQHVSLRVIPWFSWRTSPVKRRALLPVLSPCLTAPPSSRQER